MTAQPADLDWQARAACGGQDPSIWVPDYEPRQPTRAVRKAVQVCRGCPVAAECLAHATVGPYGSKGLGIYAGLTTWQRRQMLRTTDDPRPRSQPPGDRCADDRHQHGASENSLSEPEH